MPYPVIAKSHVFLRPTRSDGFSISLAESLYLGVPAIASDVRPRPQGTIVFKNGNADDFYIQVKKTLENLDVERQKPKGLDIKDAKEDLLKLYHEI